MEMGRRGNSLSVGGADCDSEGSDGGYAESSCVPQHTPAVCVGIIPNGEVVCVEMYIDGTTIRATSETHHSFL